MSGFIYGKDNSAVEDLLSQAQDLYVLEQVAKINCSGFTDDSTLPINIGNRLRRLKSLPVSRPEPVSSSSRQLLSHSKSMARYPEKTNRGNVSSSVSAFSNQVGKSCPSVSSRGGLGESSDSRRIGSSSSRFSRGNVSSSALSNYSGKSCPLDSSLVETHNFSRVKHNPRVNSRGGTPTTQTLKLLPREKSRISSASSTCIDLASTSSDQDQREGMNRKSKSKSKFLNSWFDKFSPAQAMCCLRVEANA